MEKAGNEAGCLGGLGFFLLRPDWEETHSSIRGLVCGWSLLKNKRKHYQERSLLTLKLDADTYGTFWRH